MIINESELKYRILLNLNDYVFNILRHRKMER